MKFSNFNLESIDSELLNNMDLDSSDKDLEVFINIDQSILNDFNKRNVTYIKM